MTATDRPTGLKGPDREETRSFQLANRRFRAGAAVLPRIVIQPIRRIRRQPVLGDCVGEGSGGRFHALTGFDCSGRQIWREAQRRESGTFDPNDGAYLEYAVEGLIHRGVVAYVPEEEFDTSDDLETWTEGHAAHDWRQLNMEHHRLDLADIGSCYTALAAGMAVFDGGGVTSKFMQRTASKAYVPADLDELGGSANGHAQGIPGYWLDATLDGVNVGDLLLYQGSWDTTFAGCYVPRLSAEGTIIEMVWQPGCFWAKARTFAQRWDCHAFRPIQ